jgi:hypothetical protein
VVSIEARPAYISRDDLRGSVYFSSVADRIRPVAPLTKNIWATDLAHQPSFTYVPYLLTGDWFYLEEMQFWAAYSLAYTNSGACHYCRGPGNAGYIKTETRGEAWALRNIAHAAVMTPDDQPEKGYVRDKVLDNIAVKEGYLNVRDGEFVDSSRKALYEWGRETVAFARMGVENPLGFLAYPPQNGNVNPKDLKVNPAKTHQVHSAWQFHFNYLVWGHMEELGFPIRPLRVAGLKFVLHELRDPEFNPYLTSAYIIPIGPAKDTYFHTWGQVLDGYQDSFKYTKTWLEGVGDPELGYGAIAMAAASYLTDVNDGNLRGAEAWQWIRDNLPRQELFNENPKWALTPRGPDAAVEARINTWDKRFRVWNKSVVNARLAANRKR